MSQRYSLRFESGERAGEVVPISGTVFTIGRRPGNSLQISEASVSGKHAQLSISSRGIELRDLGSTNGTLADGQRVVDGILLAHATAIQIGQVRLTLLDEEWISAGGGAAESGEWGGGSGELDRSDLERGARRGSRKGILLLAAIALAGGGALWYLERGGGSEGHRSRPVPVVEGNLLAQEVSSFEGEDGWSPVEELPATFRITPSARYSGERGLAADLVAGEAAEQRSDAVETRPERRLTVAAQVRVRGDALARIGLAFLPEPEEESLPAETMIWSPPLPAGDGSWMSVSFSATTPGGYDQVRVVLRADAAGVGASEGTSQEDLDPQMEASSGGGHVDFDDVSLQAAPGAKAADIGSADFYLDGGNLTLFQVNHVTLSGFGVLVEGEAAPPGTLVPAELEVLENGVRFVPRSGGRLRMRAEVPAFAGGLATLGVDGYQVRDGSFEGKGVTDLLFGSGHELVRLALGGALDLRATRLEDGALELSAPLESGLTPILQVRFQDEQRRMVELTARAERAEKQGRVGEALSAWQSLLDEVPFDGERVARAQEARARLLREGFARAAEIEAEVERARFFRLVDLYRACRADAEALRERYAGSAVAERADGILSAVDAELSRLEAQLDQDEVRRLKAIRAGLLARGAEGLAGEVQRYLTEKYGGAGTGPAEDADSGSESGSGEVR